MTGQPNIESRAQFDPGRYHFPSERAGINHNAPIPAPLAMAQHAAHVFFIASKCCREPPRNQLSEVSLAVWSDLDHEPVLNQLVAVFNRLACSTATPFVRWMEGFETYRNEMVFERSGPSCYSCDPFTALANQSRIVLVGFAGESACLSTLIDAFDRNQQGHLFLRRIGQPRTRRHVGGRSPPRRFKSIRNLWRCA
jgi:hypothetical protein